MNAIWLAVFLSGVLNNPMILQGEKDYIREYAISTEWNEQTIEIYLEREFNHEGLRFLLQEEFGRKGIYILNWIVQQREDRLSDAHIKDFDVIDITIDDRLIRLEKHRGTMVLRYERRKG